ncbi:HAD family hydrolase [Brevibacillus fulvus]|uniref:Cof subfamily protein (Haloacid dehalogenase superfamily) n=1 Tax=Brevibacillus fulvus TaxID=1125967 RepID=A0A939BTU6_9BACL|nr:HAD family hydrolase [Brevibacillus fulvus]MBM7592187.1 Cof subfamily protein (haloacid dehalogenase superfamily) [Brevibacillus fulvus]
MVLSQVRLAAFDMDGTLLNKDGKMAETTKEACRLLQATGCKLVISTGRTFATAQTPIDAFPFDGFVCSNGATVHEKDGTLIESTILPTDMLLDALHRIRQQPVFFEMHDTESTRWMVEEDKEMIEQIIQTESVTPEDVALRRFTFYNLAKIVPLQELEQKIKTGEKQFVKIFVWHQQEEVLKQVQEQMQLWSEVAFVTSSGSTNVEIMPKGVSKWTGLQYFCRKWGVTPDQVMAFGDADNDLEILSNAGVSVAMGNAFPHVKAIAKFTAKDHDENGVAQFILEQVLPALSK